MNGVLLGPDGQPMARMVGAAGGTPHRAADPFSREMSGWNPGLLSPDAAWLDDRDTVVARTADMVRNNGLAAGAVQRQVDAVIGSDFRLSYRPDYTALGKTASWARGFAREVEAAFRSYAYDVRGTVDAGGRLTLPAILGLAFRHVLADGEAIVVPQWIERPGTSWRTCFQVVDPDRLSNPYHAMDTEDLRGGIELNDFGGPEAYHFQTGHPSDVWAGFSAQQWTRLPRMTDHGRFRVMHHFEQEEAGQTRGKSRFAAVLERFKMQERWANTELQAALINALFVATLESPFDPAMFEQMVGSLPNYTDERLKFWNSSGKPQIEGARILHTFPGETLNFSTASRPPAGYADFERAVLRYISAGLGIGYEQLAQDWSQTNYSSARASMLETWKFLMARRGSFVSGVATPMFGCWLEEAIDLGIVTLPHDSPSFWEAYPAWTRCRWIGPARGWVDPEKEAKGIGLRLQHGVSTLQIEAAEQGAEWDEILEQQAAEQALRVELGLSVMPLPPQEETVPDAEDNNSGGDSQANQTGLSEKLAHYEARMARLAHRARVRNQG